MTIVELYNNNFSTIAYCNSADMMLVEYKKGIFVGIDSNGIVTVAVQSSNRRQGSTARRTALISVECNMNMTYTLDGESYEDVFHLVKFYSHDKKEIELFLETSMLLISRGDATKDSILITFQTLVKFFEDKEEPSDNELTGLYAELFTICFFDKDLSLGNFWQSKDRLKYDFSISDALKVEVKSTIKSNRIHHFRHDQLNSDLYKIFVISYLLQHDDNGLSLLELINKCKPLLDNDQNKVMRLNKVQKNVDSRRLESISFEEKLTINNMRIFRAEDIPKFKGPKPDGLTNAEYDCDLDGITVLSIADFIEEIKRGQEQEENEE